MTMTETNNNVLLAEVSTLTFNKNSSQTSEDVRWCLNTLAGKQETNESKVATIYARLAKREEAHRNVVLALVRSAIAGTK